MSIALAIPHTPWIPERVASLAALLRTVDGPFHASCRKVFGEREPNWAWSAKLWRWGLETRCEYLLQLQDDAIVAPNFWRILNAMLRAVPDQIVGLEAAHPAGRLLARDGHRWYRSRAWLVGVGYVIPRAALEDLVLYRTHHEEEARGTNEDDFIARFCVESERDVWHPIPTIIDHDLEVPSTYGNDHHMHRKPTVLWTEYGDVEVQEPEFWEPGNTVPPIVTNPHLEACWFCQDEPSCLIHPETHARIGRKCLASGVANVLMAPRGAK